MGYDKNVEKTYSSHCTWTNTYGYKIDKKEWYNMNRDKVYHGNYFDPKPPYGWQGALSYRRGHMGVISFISQFDHYRKNINKTIKSGRLWLKVDHAFLHGNPGMKHVCIRGFKLKNWSAPGKTNTDCIDWDIKYYLKVMKEGSAYYVDLNRETLDKIKKGSINGFVLWPDSAYNYRIRINTKNLNVRSGPSTKYKVLGQVHSGKVYMSYDRKSGWHKIKYNDKDGWVSGEYTNYTQSTVHSDNEKYGYMYGYKDKSNAPRIELKYDVKEYVEEPCNGYGQQGCSCNNKCYGNSSACSCDGKSYNTCACDSRCHNYQTTCACNYKQYGHVPCSCNQRCNSEGGVCRCDNKTYDEFYTCQICYNKCDGYTSCQTCDGCNSYQACSCNGPCDRDSCDRCHHKNYGLYTENCLRNIIQYPVSKCPEDA